MDREKTVISLSHDEALILSDLLHNISEDESIFPDIADRQVLWSIEAQLDKALTEPFLPNYVDIVNEAKNRIRYKDE